MDIDCGFTNGSGWFRYRAGAIIIENGCVLMVKNDRDDYYYSVGGGVHLGEKAEDAVRREVLEETGVPYEVERLVFIHENLFHGDSCVSLKGLDCHEIAFYFLMKPRGTQELTGSISVTADGAKENLYWLPVESFGSYHAFPSFFRDELKKLPDGVKHIVTCE